MSFKPMDTTELEKILKDVLDPDEAAEEMLICAGAILEKELRKQVSIGADKGYATGNLVESITVNKPKKNTKGHYISVTAKGIDKNGVRNNEKLAYLNYGTSKQEAMYVIDKCNNVAEDNCINAMQEKFDERLKNA